MADPLQIRPLSDRVLVRKLPPSPNKYKLIVVRDHPDKRDFLDNDTSGEHQDVRRVGVYGVVVAVGPGYYEEESFKFHPTTLKPGQVVMFSDWNDWEGAPENYAMIRERDVWGEAQA